VHLESMTPYILPQLYHRSQDHRMKVKSHAIRFEGRKTHRYPGRPNPMQTTLPIAARFSSMKCTIELIYSFLNNAPIPSFYTLHNPYVQPSSCRSFSLAT
jgi:hypothetical protein